MKRQDDKTIGLKSEDIEDILSRPPHALIRWGITAFGGILLLFFIGGYFFKYPDLVKTKITITTEYPPVWVVARTSGKLQEIYKRDKAKTRAKEIIAVLENSAFTKDVLQLERMLPSFTPTDSFIIHSSLPDNLILGNVQNAYTVFVKSVAECRNFFFVNIFAQKEKSTCIELQEYHQYITHLKKQIGLSQENVQIASIAYEREKKIFEKGLISQADYEKAKQVFWDRKQGLEQLMSAYSSTQIQESNLKQDILKTQMERRRERNILMNNMSSALNNLKVSIGEWKMSYLLISPSNGTLSYNNVWQKNQNINSNEKVFSIVADYAGEIIGRIKLPVQGAGKIKEGQRVNISLDEYPYIEFGYLTGRVSSISLLPNEEKYYIVIVKLPQKLQTSYGKLLDFKGELDGTAEIVTDDHSFTERLFTPLRKLLENFT